MKTPIHTASAPQAIGPYSQAVATSGNRFLFLSGQIPLHPETGQVVPGGIKEQTERVLQNLEAVLRAGGATMAHVVKTTVFLKNMEDFPAMNEVYARFFTDHPPARSTLEAARLPRGVEVEIELIAVLE
jgi:2-iminobutanoate/2-iminopropanoate deaminase